MYLRTWAWLIFYYHLSASPVLYSTVRITWNDPSHDERGQVAELGALIKANHPYECPEFVVMNVVDGLPDYLSWVRLPPQSSHRSAHSTAPRLLAQCAQCSALHPPAPHLSLPSGVQAWPTPRLAEPSSSHPAPCA